MKPKRTMKDRTCNQCESPIAKGDQYAQRSVRVGDSGMVAYDGTVKIWEPFYAKVSICATCAEG